MQRREAKSGVKDRKCHRRPNERNDIGENPHRNGLSRVGVGICGFVGLDGGHDKVPPFNGINWLAQGEGKISPI
jgi:hypothetical protein